MPAIVLAEDKPIEWPKIGVFQTKGCEHMAEFWDKAMVERNRGSTNPDAEILAHVCIKGELYTRIKSSINNEAKGIRIIGEGLFVARLEKSDSKGVHKYNVELIDFHTISVNIIKPKRYLR